MSRTITRPPTFLRHASAAALLALGVLTGLSLVGCAEEDVDRAGDEIRAGVDEMGEAIEKGARQVEEGIAEELGPEMERVGSDSTITSRIKTRIARDNAISLFNIDVDTVNGRVSLNGTVSSQEAKDAAEKIARETDGVVAVTNLVQVTDN